MKKQNLSTLIKVAIFTGLIPLSTYANICTIVERKFERKGFEKISDFDKDFQERYNKYKERCDLEKYKIAEEKFQKKQTNIAKDEQKHADFIKDRESIELTTEDLRDYYDNSPIIAYRASLKYKVFDGNKEIYLQKISDANAICQNILGDKKAKAKSALVSIAEKEHMGQVRTPQEVSDQLESRFDGAGSSAAFKITKRGIFDLGDNVESGTVTEDFETSRKERMEFNADLRVLQANGKISTFASDIRALEFSKLECINNPVNEKDTLDDIETKTTIETRVNSAKIDSDEDEQKVIVKFEAQEKQNFMAQKGNSDRVNPNQPTINDIRRGETTEKYTVDDQIDFILGGSVNSRSQ
ncbi:hypothetical protein ABMA77_04875 [Halobacteriovorax sp. RZ-1]|uniref:hypothetical protein n=1 Tax=unclassified Halobacteriovorax TaxID=2639665 RepID=UPI003723D125